MKQVKDAGGIVVNGDNELLMIYIWPKWDLPKGHVEEGETPEECALREVREETGLNNLSIESFVGTTKHSYYDEWSKEKVTKETSWYFMTASRLEQLKPLLREEIEKVEWIPRRKIEEYMPDTYKNIREIIKKSPFYVNK